MHLQMLMCLLGQSKVFEEASELFKKLLNIEISAPQIQRVSEYYGGVSSEAIAKNIKSCIPELKHVGKEDEVYVMVDGSMLFTREEKWNEVKLARVFNGNKIIPLSEKRSEIVESIYVSHLGSVDEFFPKLERHLAGYSKKVIIGDGAKWIWNWADDNYPGAIQILDFYHAREKLVILSNLHIKEGEKRSNWLEECCKKLMENQVELVIRDIQKLRSPSQEAKQSIII